MVCSLRPNFSQAISEVTLHKMGAVLSVGRVHSYDRTDKLHLRSEIATLAMFQWLHRNGRVYDHAVELA